MKCGLLGRKLGHSYSPAIHSHLENYPYGLFEVEPEQLEHFLKQGDFTGLNVTMPYKQAVIPYLDELSPIAKRLGAVNTIVRRDGRLIGHNTDYFGFQSLLKQSGVNVKDKKALVLGSGGASKTCQAVLEELGAQVVVISRSGENNYGNIQDHADAALLVNATPVGMYPNNFDCLPVDPVWFGKLECVLDLIYNPARTELMLFAEDAGIPCHNGLLMLVAQAKEAAEWFTGEKIAESEISRIYRIMKQQTENIILIGMPGCGKSTVGRLLAQKLQKPFADTDAWIAENFGKSASQIIREDGIEHFRICEVTATHYLGKGSGQVIATGGGCVTAGINYAHLHKNGILIWLQRDLDKLPTEGRPLSQAGALEDMYAERKPLYAAFADYTIDNNGSLEATILQILEVLL